MTALPLDELLPGSLPPHTAIVSAPAKVNLFLRVLGRRDDGYHDLETLVVPVSLADRLQIHAFADAKTFRGLSISLDVTGEPALASQAPLDETNLVVRAAEALAEAAGGVRGFAEAVLEKNVPVSAGLGGGSGDAAATLRALNDLWRTGLPTPRLVEIAAGIGSDVPAMILGEPALARGRGERVERRSVAAFDAVLVPFTFAVRTADAFRWWDEDGAVTGPDPSGTLAVLGREAVEDAAPSGLDGLLRNDLEGPVTARHAVIGRVRDRLLRAGVAAATMSGSGPTVVGLFGRGRERLDTEAQADIEALSGRHVLYASSRSG